LEIAFSSFQTAQNRKAMIEQTGRHCSSIGVAFQARCFCRNFYLAGTPAEYSEAYRECRDFIRKHAAEIRTDREINLLEKCKYLLITSRGIGRFHRWRKGVGAGFRKNTRRYAIIWRIPYLK